MDVVLLVPGLDPEVRGVFLGAMRTNPETAHILLLSISPKLKEALLDEQAVSASWQSLFEALVREIEAALQSVGNTGEPPAEAAVV